MTLSEKELDATKKGLTSLPNTFDHASCLALCGRSLSLYHRSQLTLQQSKQLKVKQLRITIESAIDRLQRFLLELDRSGNLSMCSIPQTQRL